MKYNTLPFYAKLALVLIAIICLGYLAILGKTLLAPLLSSFLLALLLLPMANYMERKLRFKRALSSMVSVIVMISVISAILFFLVNQLSDLGQDWPLLKQQAMHSFEELQRWVSNTFNVNAHKQIDYLKNSATSAVATSATLVGTTLMTLSSSLLFMAFLLLFTFFILNYRRILYSFLKSVFKEEHAEKVSAIVNQIQYIIKRYILGLFLQMLIVTGVMILVLSLLGVKYAVLLGLITGIFNVVPYIGIFSALLISVLITFATAGAAKVLLVIISFVAVHALDGNILLPLVVGSKVKINALFAFIGIVVGEMLWGISGMFLCIPYLAMLKIIFDRIDELKPWGILLGDEDKPGKKRKVYRITKKITLEEPE
ncbi:AI-2E family transporter [Pedobacter antarcticus]|uniref:Permease n=2 Tax=Pedobacter antarcticus TaxID=34086 RepID=A0A081PEH9_9SPHI|nr:AI-2E family transporter [Pedobacter antarcticus]KEQ29102.1 permease [Pedobacter antarcticus 4BY]SDM38361.1 Predicted PurR-regulated permease PerM [Pedobacter antarcticus]SFE94129.1 Predicted PurR-regulated permease PerM [Pedobacter antarcticus]